jgi:hypothetical protein
MAPTLFWRILWVMDTIVDAEQKEIDVSDYALVHMLYSSLKTLSLASADRHRCQYGDISTSSFLQHHVISVISGD